MLSSVGIKTVVDALAPQLERASGHKVAPVFDLASAFKARIEGGEPSDVPILTPPLLDDLIAEKIVSASSRSAVARVGLGLTVRAGAPKTTKRISQEAC